MSEPSKLLVRLTQARRDADRRFIRAADKVAAQFEDMIARGSMIPDRTDLEFVRAARALRRAVQNEERIALSEAQS